MRKPANLPAYDFTYRVGDKIIHRGITNDPPRLERELQQQHPGGVLTVDGLAEIRGGVIRPKRHWPKFRAY